MVPFTAVKPKMESISSDVSFALLKVLVALTLSESILHFEVDKVVGYWGKLKHLYLLGNFTSIAKLQSLLQACEYTKLIPLQAYGSSLCLRTQIVQTVYLMPNGAILWLSLFFNWPSLPARLNNYSRHGVTRKRTK